MSFHAGIKVEKGKGREQQGIDKMKQNYDFEAHTMEEMKIGKGGYGTVIKTTSIANPSFEVAIKMLDKNHRKICNKLHMIMQEVKILNTIDHPNIVKYYETYEDENNVYLVMEYIKGKSLQAYLK